LDLLGLFLIGLGDLCSLLLEDSLEDFNVELFASLDISDNLLLSLVASVKNDLLHDSSVVLLDKSES
jgi:hypothetical protein